MIRRTSAFALLLATSAAFAEGDGDKAPPAPAPAPAPQAPPPATAPAPAQPAAGETEPVTPVRGVRYRVTLKSGRTLTGVVTAASTFERRQGSNWVAAEQETPGAGLRLFFPHDQEGFVFVASRDIKSAEKVGDLTEDEGREMAQQRTVGARKAAEERDRLRKERDAREQADKAKAAEAEKTRTEETGKPEDQVARYTALLAKFPPSRWTPETPKEIERRRVVMDLLPTEDEREFLAVFEEWSKAYAAWKAGQEKAPREPSAPATEPKK
jgi:hypothetical protein